MSKDKFVTLTDVGLRSINVTPSDRIANHTCSSSDLSSTFRQDNQVEYPSTELLHSMNATPSMTRDFAGKKDGRALKNEELSSSIYSNTSEGLRSSSTSSMKTHVYSKPHQPTLHAVHFLAGGMGGILGATITCPLEVVKTRLQSTTYVSSYSASYQTMIPKNSMAAGQSKIFSLPTTISKHISSTFEVMRSIYKAEGVLALWKGLGPTLLGVGPSRAMNFGTYSWVKDHLSQMTRSNKDSSWIHITSASCAGIVSTTVTNPLWMIKTRLQLQSDFNLSTGNYKTSLQCLNDLVRNEGLKSLYRGLSASYLGIAETVIQFVLYEKLKLLKKEHDVHQIMAEKLLDYDNACQYLNERKRSLFDWTSYLFIAGSAKLTASILTYPHEVLRTRLRQPAGPDGINPYGSLNSAIRLMIRQEGYLAFYNGLTAHLLRVVPNSAIMFLTYEAVVYAFSHSRGGVYNNINS